MTHAPESIVCKPTHWFLFRAAVMLLLFGGFAAWFYYDASTGYRKKNLVFYLYQTFQHASGEFSRMNTDGSLTPEAWKAHAAQQSVRFPENASVLPANLELPMQWPMILHDYGKMKPLQWKQLWLEYSKVQGMPASPPEESYDARKIGEQWAGVWVCLALALGVLFILLRTMSRSVRADAQAITAPNGRRIPYAELKTLDLRKWETKGLAYIDYDGPSGKGRVRIDGLTYGGFKKEQGEPAERLMKLIRSRFSGEILEYAPLLAESPSPGGEPGAS
jgi:hypothetical protein